MIARKIVYEGKFDDATVADIFDITRKNDITGEVKKIADNSVELLLEGDPSQIKLIQHQIERKVKNAISGKSITSIPFQYYSGITFLNF